MASAPAGSRSRPQYRRHPGAAERREREGPVLRTRFPVEEGRAELAQGLHVRRGRKVVNASGNSSGSSTARPRPTAAAPSESSMTR
jgi:hypothetical protein